MKNTKEGAEVVYTLHRADDNRIVKMHAKRKIRPHGDRGYIPMPKELIGKFVIVTFEEGAEKNVPSLGAMSMLLPCTQRRM